MLRKKITAQAKRWTVSLLTCMFMLSSACRSPDRSRTAAESHIATIDRMEILDIISQYSHTWDDRNANSWADLFVDSAEWKFHADGAPKRAIKTKSRDSSNSPVNNSGRSPSKGFKHAITRPTHCSHETRMARFMPRRCSLLFGRKPEKRLPIWFIQACIGTYL